VTWRASPPRWLASAVPRLDAGTGGRRS
jgi:hypothetical protein